MEDPLIVILGIGDYHDKSQNLLGIETDYKRCIKVFNGAYNYSIFYQNDENKNVYKSEKIGTGQISHVKIEWKEAEILKFFQDARDVVVNNNHDGLNIIISSHGESGGVILDSDSEEVSLMQIYWTFTGDECAYLKDKPKIFFVDACRGGMLCKAESTEKKGTGSKSSSNNSGNTTETQISTIKTKSLNSSSTYDHDKNDENASEHKNDANKIEKNSFENRFKKKEAYHKEANFRFIYGSIDGYAIVEGGTKGGYLIQALCSVFSNVEKVVMSNLDKIVYQINKQAIQRTGTSIYVPHIEDLNRMDGPVTFRIKPN